MTKSEFRDLNNIVRTKSKKLLVSYSIILLSLVAAMSVLFSLKLVPEIFEAYLALVIIFSLVVPQIIVYRKLQKMFKGLKINCFNCMCKIEINTLQNLNENSVCVKCNNVFFDD